MLFKITGFFVAQEINNINGNDNNDNDDDDDDTFHVYLMLVYLIHDYQMKTWLLWSNLFSINQKENL